MAFVLWITGLPGSGKSTVAEALKTLMPGAVVLRMDDLRKVVTPEPTYSEQERDLLYRSLVYLAVMLNQNGHTVIIDATANLRKWRDLARETIKDYLEVYLRCPVEECAHREQKRTDTHQAPRDIYRKATTGWPVPGVNAPYEEPLNPDLTIDTNMVPVAEAVDMIMLMLRQKRSLPE
ncbi:MAG: adenylyl-sulfate kinase [bacterium]